MTDTILLFLVLPLATIILSIVLQKLLRCPILVAATFFAVYLILTYTVFDTDFLIFAIVYTILAFITAFLTSLFCRILRRLRELENGDSNNDNNGNSCTCGCGCGRNNSNSGRSGCGCGCNNSDNNGCNCGCGCGDNDSDDTDNGNLLTISSRCGNGENTDLLTISTGGTCGNNNGNGNGNGNGNNNGNNGNNNCGCNNNERIIFNAQVQPTNNGNAGSFRGCYRRRFN